MKLKDILIATFALALIASLGLLWLAPAGLKHAPDITFTTISGETISMQGLRGQPVLVTFWATTCTGCVKEMPHLAELHRELSPRGFSVIGIAMAYDPPNQVVTFSKARGIPYPVALDINSEAAIAFGDIRLTPTTFLIAPDGRVVHQKIGELDMPKVRSLVIDMLPRSQLDAPTVELAAR